MGENTASADNITGKIMNVQLRDRKILQQS